MMPDIIAVLTVLSAAVQLFYLHYFFARGKRTSRHLTGPAPEHLRVHPSIRMSVIICARNEADNLRRNLPSVLEQDYRDTAGNPMYEVIVVNDASTDGTPEVLRQLGRRYGHLRTVPVPPDAVRTMPGKKFALSEGVKHAAGEYLLLTDADCRPGSDKWIRWMSYPFAAGREIVAGYGPVEEAPGLLNRFVRLETFHTYLQYLSYHLAGIPYMAVGRNLACTKALLLRVQQHASWTKTPSGDDDLLVNLCATKDNMLIHTHPESYTWTESQKTWKAWWRQKQRHVSAGKYYNKKAKTVAGLYALTHGMTWGGFLCCLVFPPAAPLFKACALAFFLRAASFSVTYPDICRSYAMKVPWFFFLAFDFGWMIYNFALSPFIFWKNKRQWT